MRINKNVDMMGIDPALMLIIMVAKSAFESEESICEITSLVRGVGRSYHPLGFAVDFGVDNFPDNPKDRARRVADMIRACLPDYCDVVYGDKNHLDHIHVEIDKKKYIKWQK